MSGILLVLGWCRRRAARAFGTGALDITIFGSCSRVVVVVLNPIGQVTTQFLYLFHIVLMLYGLRIHKPKAGRDNEMKHNDNWKRRCPS